MRLCLALGYPNTRVMFKHMTKQDFLDWWAFHQVEPIGGVRGDYHAASVCAAIMNGLAATVRSRKRYKLSEFLLEWKPADEVTADDKKPGDDGKRPWQEMKMVARMWAASSKVDDKPGRRGRTNKVSEAKVAEARAALKLNDRRPKR